MSAPELDAKHAAAIAGGSVVLHADAANLIVFLLRLCERFLGVDGPEELVARLRLPPDNAALLLEVRAALIAAVELSRRSTSGDFRAETPSEDESLASSSTWMPPCPVPTAAELLGLSNRRVRQLAASGRIEGRRGPNGWQLDRVSVEEFRRSRTAA
jgi:hypothetical protein